MRDDVSDFAAFAPVSIYFSSSFSGEPDVGPSEAEGGKKTRPFPVQSDRPVLEEHDGDQQRRTSLRGAGCFPDGEQVLCQENTNIRGC